MLHLRKNHVIFSTLLQLQKKDTDNIKIYQCEMKDDDILEDIYKIYIIYIKYIVKKKTKKMLSRMKKLMLNTNRRERKDLKTTHIFLIKLMIVGFKFLLGKVT